MGVVVTESLTTPALCVDFSAISKCKQPAKKQSVQLSCSCSVAASAEPTSYICTVELPTVHVQVYLAGAGQNQKASYFGVNFGPFLIGEKISKCNVSDG